MTKRSLPYVVAVAALALVVVSLSPSGAAPAGAQAAATARLEAARAAFDVVKVEAAAGRSTSEAVYTWSVRVLTAQLGTGAKAPAALQEHLQRVKDLETAVEGRVKSGMAPRSEALAAAYYRAEAELWVARKAMR